MRPFCFDCRKAKVTCYCPRLRRFEAGPLFVILTHPRELRNSVATGRMLHLSITNSLLISGHDFTDDPRVNALLSSPSLHCAMLYPGRESLNLSRCSPSDAASFVPSGKRLALFIIDGTWDLARGMINRSANLRALPQLSFTPESRSAYEIRRQPEAHCLSTLECAHWIIQSLDSLGLYPKPTANEHDGLLETFRFMVAQQLAYEAQSPKRAEGRRISPNAAGQGRGAVLQT